MALAACGGSGLTRESPAAGGAFSEPEVLRSVGGRLDVTLAAAATTVAFGDGRRDALTYNGSTPGPTLRLRPGDVLTVTLVNRLDEPTNLHTHGLHVSPSGDADNIFVTIAPDEQHRYRYEVPADHRSRLFWYHPHHHGTVAAQVFRGLAGAIVITDDLDTVPEIAESRERLMVIADPAVNGTNGVSMMQRMLGREGDVVLVNGVLAPRVVARAGELERWRLLNASPSRYYRVALEGHPSNSSRPMVAGSPCRSSGRRSASRPANAPRCSWRRPRGSYGLVSRPYDRGSPRMGGASTTSRTTCLATLTVRGTGGTAALPASLATVEDLRRVAVDRTRTLTLGMGTGMGGGGRGMGGGAVTIDGAGFDPRRIDLTARLGTVEDWIVRNTSSMDHPFHLHVWPFQVLEGGDGTPDRAWKDTVNVPAGREVRLRVRFADIAGRTVYHCHILDHEDLGMMGVIDVR